MDNRHDDISASDLLAKLKANMAEEETAPVAETAASAATSNVGKKYHFRRAPKSAEALSDEAIAKEMPLSEEELL